MFSAVVNPTVLVGRRAENEVSSLMDHGDTRQTERHFQSDGINFQQEYHYLTFKVSGKDINVAITVTKFPIHPKYLLWQFLMGSMIIHGMSQIKMPVGTLLILDSTKQTLDYYARIVMIQT